MYNAKLTKIVEEFQLESILPEVDISARVITRKEINRPALQLTGFYHRFDNDRWNIAICKHWMPVQEMRQLAIYLNITSLAWLFVKALKCFQK